MADIYIDDVADMNQIVYAPIEAWFSDHERFNECYAASCTCTNSTGASAFFKFKGIGIRYMGYGDQTLPNTNGLIEVELDGVKTPISGNNGSPQRGQQILFEKQDLPYDDHLIIIRKVGPPIPAGLKGFDLTIDAFIYRIPNSATTIPVNQSTPTSQTTAPSNTSAGPSDSTPVGPIIGGILGGLVAGAILATVFWHFLRKRRAAAVSGTPHDVPSRPEMGLGATPAPLILPPLFFQPTTPPTSDTRKGAVPTIPHPTLPSASPHRKQRGQPSGSSATQNHIAHDSGPSQSQLTNPTMLLSRPSSDEPGPSTNRTSLPSRPPSHPSGQRTLRSTQEQLSSPLSVVSSNPPPPYMQ